MGMTWTNTKPALLRRLKRWGDFTSTEALSRFYEAVITACNRIRRAGEWDWKNAHENVVTTAGNLGPYDAPASFYRMVLERKVYLYGFADTLGQVMAPILETDTTRWHVIYRVTDGKLYFRSDPGAGTVTFNFVATIDNNPTEGNATTMVEAMPGNLFDVLADFLEADFLGESPDTKAEAIAMMNEAAANLAIEYNEFEKGKPRQRQRSPRGVDGYPLDGMGRQISIHRRSTGGYPRGRHH
jgi:hypothetical protein